MATDDPSAGQLTRVYLPTVGTVAHLVPTRAWGEALCCRTPPPGTRWYGTGSDRERAQAEHRHLCRICERARKSGAWQS